MCRMKTILKCDYCTFHFQKKINHLDELSSNLYMNIHFPINYSFDILIIQTLILICSMISKHLHFRLQEEYEKSKQRDTDNNVEDIHRSPSDGEDLIERIKYHQELVDLERKVIQF